jgi:hypothetical protein
MISAAAAAAVVQILSEVCARVMRECLSALRLKSLRLLLLMRCAFCLDVCEKLR